MLDAARAEITEAGASALSMRSVARRLGVAPNALYSYVANKTQLVDDVLDDALGDVALHAPAVDDQEPVEAIAAMMTSTYRVLTSHTDLVPLYLSRQGARGPNAVQLGHALDDLLVRAGVPRSRTAEARRALIVHAVGSAAFATNAPEGARPLSKRTLLGNFTMSLRWLLDGMTSGRD